MIYRFTFVEGENMAEVEATVGLSIIAASCLIGDAAMRLDFGYVCDHEKRKVVMRAHAPATECAIRIFCGFCSHEYGESSFTVERLQERPAAAASATGDNQCPREVGAATTRQSAPSGVGILADTGVSCAVCGGRGEIPIPDAPCAGGEIGTNSVRVKRCPACMGGRLDKEAKDVWANFKP